MASRIPGSSQLNDWLIGHEPKDAVAVGRRFLAWGSLLAGVTVLGVYAVQYPLNHDVGWWLHVVRSVVEGEEIYRDIIEINPPLYGWLVMIPLMIADLSGLPVPAVTQATFVLVCVVVVVLASRLLHEMVLDRVTAFSGGLIFAVGVLGLPGVDFGQREHLMLALVIPYLLLDAYRTEGAVVTRRVSIAVGVAAGIGFALKPHFGLIFLLLEGTLILLGRNRWARLQRAEFLTVVVLAAGYGVVILAAFPEYIELLWDSRRLYSAFADVSRHHLLVTPYSLLITGAVIGYIVARRRRSVVRSIVLRFVIFSVAAWIVAMIQAKGWSYHFYPSYAAAVIAGLILAVDVLIDRRGGGVRRTQMVAGLACAAIATIIWMRHDASLAAREYQRLAIEDRSAIVQRAGAESFVVLSPIVSDGFPLANYAALEWTSPFSTLWWLQLSHGQSGSSAASKSSADDDSVEASFRAALVHEMLRSRPDVVFVDTAANPRFADRSFPYVSYLSQEPGFRKLWRNYDAVETSGRFIVYQRFRGDVSYAP